MNKTDTYLKEFIDNNKYLLDSKNIEELLCEANFLNAKTAFKLVELLNQCEEDGDYTPKYYVISIYSSGTFCLHYFASTESLKVNSFGPDKVEKFDNREDADKFIKFLKGSLLYKINSVKLLTVGITN